MNCAICNIHFTLSIMVPVNLQGGLFYIEMNCMQFHQTPMRIGYLPRVEIIKSRPIPLQVLALYMCREREGQASHGLGNGQVQKKKDSFFQLSYRKEGRLFPFFFSVLFSFGVKSIPNSFLKQRLGSKETVKF